MNPEEFAKLTKEQKEQHIFQTLFPVNPTDFECSKCDQTFTTLTQRQCHYLETHWTSPLAPFKYADTDSIHQEDKRE